MTARFVRTATCARAGVFTEALNVDAIERIEGVPHAKGVDYVAIDRSGQRHHLPDDFHLRDLMVKTVPAAPGSLARLFLASGGNDDADVTIHDVHIVGWQIELGEDHARPVLAAQPEEYEVVAVVQPDGSLTVPDFSAADPVSPDWLMKMARSMRGQWEAKLRGAARGEHEAAPA